MTHQYNITGMTCSSCEAKVQAALSKIPQVTKVETNVPLKELTVTMRSHVNTDALQAALKEHPKYQLTEKHSAPVYSLEEEEKKTWLQTYKPLLLVFAFITGISVLTSFSGGDFHAGIFMGRFMAGFFLAFSFFKLLDIQGFADSYSSYDLLAAKYRSYGLIYPFIELALGIAYLLTPQSQWLNIITVIVMSFSSIGVIKSVLKKRKIKCACLGAVFNLPMSTVTIIEDLLMVAMALIMLITM
jgi:copper chaperone CopZ